MLFNFEFLATVVHIVKITLRSFCAFKSLHRVRLEAHCIISFVSLHVIQYQFFHSNNICKKSLMTFLKYISTFKVIVQSTKPMHCYFTIVELEFPPPALNNFALTITRLLPVLQRKPSKSDGIFPNGKCSKR